MKKQGYLKKLTIKNYIKRLPGQELKYKKTSLNLKHLILKGDLSQNPFLFDGDIIKIERATKTDNDLLEISSSSLSPNFINVNFIGEVNKPGPYKLEANSTLIDGILLYRFINMRSMQR